MSDRAFWDLYARCYDSLKLLKPYQRLMGQAENAVHLGPGRKRALDIGCGTGNLLERLRRARPEWKLVGVDRSEAMLHRARRKLMADLHVELVRHDLDQGLPFEDSSFHAAFCVNAVYALASPSNLLLETRRVLVPSGHLLLVNPWKLKSRLIWGEHFRSLRMRRDLDGALKTLGHAHRFFFVAAVNAAIARRAQKRDFHLLPPGEALELVEQAGFQILFSLPDAYAGTCCLISAVRSS